MKIFSFIILCFIISCNTDESKISPKSNNKISYTQDSIKIINSFAEDIFILANDWFILQEPSESNNDQNNIWSTSFMSNKLYFSTKEYNFTNMEIYSNKLNSIISNNPIFYRISPNKFITIKMNINNELIGTGKKFLNYHICYIDDINLLNKMTEYHIINSDILILNFNTNILQNSICNNTINIEDKEFLESKIHKNFISSKLINNKN